MNRFCLLLSACAALAACNPQSTTGSGVEDAFDQRVASVVLPEDKSAAKPAGCPTLVAMGVFDGMSRLRGGFTADAEADLERLTHGDFPEADLVAVNSINRNDCHMVTAHAKGLKAAGGPNEVIRIILIEDLGEGRRVGAVGQKFLCKDPDGLHWRADTCTAG